MNDNEHHIRIMRMLLSYCPTHIHEKSGCSEYFIWNSVSWALQKYSLIFSFKKHPNWFSLAKRAFEGAIWNIGVNFSFFNRLTEWKKGNPLQAFKSSALQHSAAECSKNPSVSVGKLCLIKNVSFKQPIGFRA